MDPTAVFGGAPAFPTPVKTVGEKFRFLMSAAAEGVDVLRGSIIQLAREGEIDDGRGLSLAYSCLRV
jgi:hypothetical protein